MRRKTTVYIGIGTFLCCWLLLFLLPCIFEGCPVGKLTQITEGIAANFVLLTFIFACTAVVAGLTAESTLLYLRRFRPFRPKLGRILIHHGHVTQAQVEKALMFQDMRIGEVLCHVGYITEAQLEKALLRQTEQRHRRLGEIIVDLGYASAPEVQWAAERVHRKIGRVLRDMGLIREDELRSVLARQRYSRRHGL